MEHPENECVVCYKDVEKLNHNYLVCFECFAFLCYDCLYQGRLKTCPICRDYLGEIRIRKDKIFNKKNGAVHFKAFQETADRSYLIEGSKLGNSECLKLTGKKKVAYRLSSIPGLNLDRYGSELPMGTEIDLRRKR